ncbi:MAG: ABC transporter ATP-binding protein [Phycisphaerales bacterium]|nr:ABC transporter ATP-binding protein [Phycisphaerales bacterium]
MSRSAGRTSMPGVGEPPVVIAQGLVKTFKDFWMRERARAVDVIEFEIRRGEIFGLLGPNGSGKSTTIKMILGLLKKTRGRLAVFGKSPNDVSIKNRVGYLPEESYLYPFLNARETLEYYGRLFRIPARVREDRIEELLEMVGLTGVQHRQVREYSKGMQRRIGIAQALINDPEFLILDEPTTGLDPIGTRQVKDLILTLGRRGKTILLSSHLLSDVEDVVDRTVILYGGRIRAEGTCDDLLTTHSRSIIETPRLDEATLAEVRAVLERHNVEMTTSHPRQKLEDLFIQIVQQARAERAATSGADNAGGTAAFLRGDGEEDVRSGDELIESLMTSGQDAPDVEEAPAARVVESGPDTGVIDELIGGGVADDGHDAASAESAGGDQAPAADEAVDDDVIRSLLGDGDGADGERKSS